MQAAPRAADAYDRYLSRSQPGLYESHYLKANSTDGKQAFWIKHNLLVDAGGGGIGEFWLILFRRGAAARVWKREVPLLKLDIPTHRLALRGDHFDFDPEHAKGSIGEASWQLKLSGGMAPLFHLGTARFYEASIPRKKLLTPAPNLRFDGALTVGSETIAVDGWIGLRGHNWGSEHAFSYAYGNCNLWDDGALDRTFDGFTARVRVGPLTTPWLSALVYRGPDGEHLRNRIMDHFNTGAVVKPTLWQLRYDDLALSMEGETPLYVGLRYRHPNGRECYCYNTKFARVRLVVGARTYVSSSGEHEVLFPEPLPDIRLHPTPGWDAGAGDYTSAP
ncbi:MAG TPA: hypothetical protein VKN99_01635 [Polyangia bacterium]|nr:hypothetical protein [Polyangia bacterium]